MSHLRILAGARVGSLCLYLLALSSGCDAIKSVSDTPTEVATATPEPAAPMPTPAVPPMPEPMVPKTAQQVIAEFQSLKPIERQDHHLKALTELSEGLEAIQSLDLSRSGISNEGLSYLPKLSALKELDLTETRVSNGGMVSVAQVTTLRTLVLRKIEQVDNTGIQALTSLTNLEDLTIAMLPISDGVMDSIKEMKGLRRLDVSGNSSLLGQQFSDLVGKGHFTSLRELVVSQTQFGFYGLKQMNKMKELEIFRAAQCEIVDGAVTGLGGCEALRVLDVAHNKLTDDGIKGINRMKKLEELNLSGNQVTNNALLQFKTMKQLKKLSLDSTAVTESAVTELKTKFLKETEIQVAGKTL
ncbi:MAG: leucine-rich repeat domain-containing protein [Planctomycetota bacterium]|nr:MAG: leucine-rich repeat domain-containing protein [Planctomycetota bacterium]